MTLLTQTRESLPSRWYYDAAHYARELAAIWYRDWVCVGRLEEIPNPGDYRVITIGDQRLIITRDQDRQARIFHNTCRHRGSALCTLDHGHFANGRIICPYHTWTYNLEGELVATPLRIETDEFRRQDFSLYQVHSDTWGGYLFANLSKKPSESLSEFLGEQAQHLAHWPLAEMVSVNQECSILNCNWKVFWENYSECYHCPRVHPELCRVVPVYRKGLLSDADDADWKPEWEGDDGRPRVKRGLRTWTIDGLSSMPDIDGLEKEEHAIGMHFASFTASMYVVGHTDYVRSVRLLPRGPEALELIVDWLLVPDAGNPDTEKLAHMLELGRLVVEQDGRICEINQQGLKSARHEHGVLMPQEHGLWTFHQWLRERLAGYCPD